MNETPRSEYVNLPGEPLWDHAHRLLVTYFLGGASHIVLSTPGMSPHLDHPAGAYVFSYQRLKGAVLALCSSRDLLHRKFRWQRRPSGEWIGPLLSESDDEMLDVLAGTSIAFVAFVQAWQPLMDAIAEIICLLLKCKGSQPTGMPKSMPWLVRCAELDGWRERYPTLSATLLSETQWYTAEIRIKRNQFVHNQRVAVLLPEPRSSHTIVEIKKIYDDTTTERFRMDTFVNDTLAKFLLFSIGLADSAKELCRAPSIR